MILELLILLLATLVLHLWCKYKRIERYFESRDVKYVPGWPVFGNLLKSTLQMEHFFFDVDRVYKAFPKERYVGFIDSAKPSLLIRDPGLIKLITVKDFDHFTDHKDFFSEHIEPLFGSSLLMMKGEKWRHMRTTLSPAFTGSKMKHMMQFMVDISKNIVEYLKDHENEEIDVDHLMRCYTNDVIASTSFGLEMNSLRDRDNEFFRIGQAVLKFGFRDTLIMTLDDLFPNITKVLGVKLYPKKTYDFFENLLKKTVEYRKTNNVSRPDMVQLLMETDMECQFKEREFEVRWFERTFDKFIPEWTPQQLCAQAFIFFAAGFETSASSLVLTIHELAVNPDVQERLFQEIKAFKETNGEITSDSLSSLKYLDCVFNETLRKWSPSIFVDRECTKTYKLPPPSEGGKPYILNPGDVVYNSSNSLHLDPQYWPDPLKFDPDRWSDENKHKITPFTYQPFGLGPRGCLGSRFAIMEAKVLLYYLVSNFKILKCEKTTDPIELVNYGFHIKALGGTWAKFQNRIEQK